MDAEPRRRRLPSPWLANLAVFGVLLALVLGAFVHQTRQAQRAFLEDAGNHARLLANAVGLHARGAVLAQGVTDTMLRGFLGSSARFVDYLDRVEPFRADELGAFAGETGLSLIRIIRPDGVTQGPPGPGSGPGCERLQELIRPQGDGEILFGVPREGAAGCVLVGMDGRRIEELRAAIGLPRALEAVAALPGVVRVELEGTPRVEPDTAADSVNGTIPVVAMRTGAGGRAVAEARTPLAGAVLVLELDADPLVRAQRRLWIELATFGLVLVLAGGAGSWLLYRHQQAHERQLRDFERRLSREREQAGLGRAAAAIAHEIRNPLNAMGLGLQRLQMEAPELTPEHRRLVGAVLQAVHRANGSVGGLLEYARPVRPRVQAVDLAALVREQLSLYQAQMERCGIALSLDLAAAPPVPGDADLLRQVLDNLLRNALEAQPRGGELSIHLAAVPGGLELCLANAGLALDAGDVERVLEPWFTTKPDGTGLGLAISQRIAAAHGGRLAVTVPRPGRLEVRLSLPLAGAGTGTDGNEPA